MINISKDVHQPGSTVFVRMNNSAVHKCEISYALISVRKDQTKLSGILVDVMYSVILRPNNNSIERSVEVRDDQVFLNATEAFA